jgi:hypothetical protein
MTSIFSIEFEGRQTRDASAQARRAQARQGRARRQSEEPQASHCHRLVGSAQERQEGSEAQIQKLERFLFASIGRQSRGLRLLSHAPLSAAIKKVERIGHGALLHGLAAMPSNRLRAGWQPVGQ